jgi:hypothetical protein
MTLQDQRLAANHIRVADRIVKKRGSPLESIVKEGQIVFYKFSKKLRTSLEPKTIPARAIELSVDHTISNPLI